MSDQLSPEEPHRIVKDPLVEQLKDEIKVRQLNQLGSSHQLHTQRCAQITFNLCVLACM